MHYALSPVYLANSGEPVEEIEHPKHHPISLGFCFWEWPVNFPLLAPIPTSNPQRRRNRFGMGIPPGSPFPFHPLKDPGPQSRLPSKMAPTHPRSENRRSIFQATKDEKTRWLGPHYAEDLVAAPISRRQIQSDANRPYPIYQTYPSQCAE